MNATFHDLFNSLNDKMQQLNNSFHEHYQVSSQATADNVIEELNTSVQHVSQKCSLLQNNIEQLQNNVNSLLISSCAALPPSSPSGYYWIRPSIGSVVRVYCDMAIFRVCGNTTGGWMRVAALNMSDSNQQCPSELTQQNHSSIRTCVRPSEPGGQTSLFFASNTLSYSKVCGKVIAYQFGYLDAFRVYYDSGNSRGLDDYFVNGVVLTHGSPRQHIWTFVGVRDETVTHSLAGCYPCLYRGGSGPRPPPFIGNDYFCDSGSRNPFINRFFLWQ